MAVSRRAVGVGSMSERLLTAGGRPWGMRSPLPRLQI
jgi:hypothetical protein